MISHPTHWRATSDGRESVAGAGAHASLERLCTRGDTTGKITSRKPYTVRELEVIAFRLGVTVAAVQAAIAQGRLETLRG